MQTVIRETINEKILENIDQNKGKYRKISHLIHENPEKFGQEYFASQLLTDFLHQKGFEIEKGIASYETAFIARKKGKKPGRKVAFFAEYHTVPETGHVQGNHIVALISIAAATALGKVIDDIGGEVIVYGTPADEASVDHHVKDILLEKGLLTEVHAAVMVHSSDQTRSTVETFHAKSLNVTFLRDSSDLSTSTNQAVNPLDGMIRFFNDVNEWKRELLDPADIRGIITHGGEQTNIIPKRVEAKYFIQAETKQLLKEREETIIHKAQTASSLTNTEVLMTKHPNQMTSILTNESFARMFQKKLANFVPLVQQQEKKPEHATDLGNISRYVPTLYPSVQINGDNEKSSLTCKQDINTKVGDQSIILGAKAIALTMVEVLVNDKVYEEIEKDFLSKTTSLTTE